MTSNQTKSLTKLLLTTPKLVRPTQSTVRHSSTSTSRSSQSPIIHSSPLLSRAPLLLPPLTPLESTYYSYQRQIHRSLNKPLQVSVDWFFNKKGSTSEKSFLEAESAVIQGEKEGNGTIAGAESAVGKEQGAGEDANLKSLERKLDRTIYLLLGKKVGAKHVWSFPETVLLPDESLLSASERYLLSSTGPNIDVWAPGRVPAGVYESPKDGKTTFFIPMRIIRGQVAPKEKNVEFAWLTKEECKERLGGAYWEAVEDVLSDQ